MTVNLYNNASDRRCVNKSLSSVSSTSAKVKGVSSVLYPKLILESTHLGFNYIGIPEWGNRFYFVNDIQVAPGNSIIVSAEVDPLYTYKSAINSLTVNVARAEDKENKEINDNMITLAKPVCKILPFPTAVFGNSLGTDACYMIGVK